MSNSYVSTFKQAPKTKIGKWAFWLSFVSVLSGPILGLSAAIFVPFIDDTLSETASIVVGSTVAVSVVAIFFAALILSVMAFAKRERSWAVWAALIISTLQACFWAMMLLGELLIPH